MVFFAKLSGIFCRPKILYFIERCLRLTINNKFCRAKKKRKQVE